VDKTVRREQRGITVLYQAEIVGSMTAHQDRVLDRFLEALSLGQAGSCSMRQLGQRCGDRRGNPPSSWWTMYARYSDDSATVEVFKDFGDPRNLFRRHGKNLPPKK